MFDIIENDVKVVYEQLKDRYSLTLTNTFALDEGFTVDMPVIVAKANGLILELYDADILVLDVMDEARTKGTHWHPQTLEQAVADVAEFMENKTKYKLRRFPKRKG